MQGEIISYVLLAGLATALLLAAFTDLRRRQIDNWLTLAIALGAPAFWLASGFSPSAMGFQLALALVTFAVLAGLFALGQMGGGDVKLLSALALWIAPAAFLKLLMVMAIAGGVLTIIFGGLHVIRRARGKVAVPYGIAISVAGLWVLASDHLPAIQTAITTG